MAISKEELMEILEGNRRLTIRVIEAFPADKLFDYAPVEPLRPFSAMVKEILNVERAFMRGIAQDEWEYKDQFTDVSTKENLLESCEQVRAETRGLWKSVTEERLAEVMDDPFFNAPPQSHFERLQYSLENEIHHRGQGYIYLRMLGIEPPAFYIR
ncbi:damage-inducible protein DinB [Virgibacillus phasianinus]|uniref:Damage-inducible protein DinB n=1 Tax=Virgibacillus phasianinus TaxID=2017483 RepID=A0A220U2I4_9BACI|nr:DinB family protein [Virgibacillus phasianinus]ASK62368.1 damage-inducible protein DinB [Virgibacillus phasianinus]